MFFRKKKYDLGSASRYSALADDNDYSNSINRRSSDFSTGETLSRKKEQRRLSSMNQIFGSSSDGLTNKSSISSLNRYSCVPSLNQDSTATETKLKNSPIFDQRTATTSTTKTTTSLIRSSSIPSGRSHDSISNDSIVQPNIISKNGVDSPLKTFDSNFSDTKQLHKETLEKEDQLLEEPESVSNSTLNNDNEIVSTIHEQSPLEYTDLTTYQQPPLESIDFTTQGPTNIDDIMNSMNDLKYTSSNAFVTIPTDTNDNSNNNNNNNNRIPEASSISQSNFNVNSFMGDHTEIKSLRQLRKSASKPLASSMNKTDFVKSTNVKAPPLLTNESTTKIPANQSVIDSIKVTDKSQSKSFEKSNDICSSLNNSSPISINSSDPPVRSTSKPNDSHSSVFDAVPATTTSFSTAIDVVDFPIIDVVPIEYVTDANIITNIDDECQKDISNLQLRNNDLEAKEVIKPTKIYVGSGFTNHHHPTPQTSKTNEENLNKYFADEKKSEVNCNLQNNCVSRIIIKNDIISLTSDANTKNEKTCNRDIDETKTSNHDFQVFQSTISANQDIIEKGFDETRNDMITNDLQRNKTKDNRTLMVDDFDVPLNDKRNNFSDNIDRDNIEEVSNHHISSLPIFPNEIENQDHLSSNELKPNDSLSDNKIPDRVGKFRLNVGSQSIRTKDKDGQRNGKDDKNCEDEHEFFKRKTKINIEGCDGSVRGVKNMVRSGISAFVNTQENQLLKTLVEQSKGKIILFTTSMSVIRTTRDKCSDVKKVLQNHRIFFEERDVYISEENAKDLIQRFRIEGQKSQSKNQNKTSGYQRSSGVSEGCSDYTKAEYEDMLVKLPRVFVEDLDLGSYEEVLKLNETGILRKIFKEFPKVEGDITCHGCGGFRYTPCYSCHGSKKSRSNAFTEEFFGLRCIKCDENGIARCKVCNTEQTSDE